MKQIKSKVLIILLGIVMAMSLIACGQKNATKDNTNSNVPNSTGNEEVNEEATDDSSKDTSDESDAKRIVPTKDRVGNDIVVTEKIERIISLAPSTSQILVELGLGDLIVAVDSQTPLYAQVDSKIPQFDIMAPDMEQILALQPDIVFITSMSNYSGEDVFVALRNAGVCIAEIPSSNSIESIQADIQFISDCVDKTSEGKEIITKMDESLSEIKAIGASITDKKSVLFEIAAAPYIYSFGKGVFLNEMIELIGATNVLANEENWLPVTEEAAILFNPDVILTSVNYIEDPISEILSRTGFETVTAVMNKDVYYIDNGASSLPNHNIVIALKEMAKAVYPNEYSSLK